jgi:hypothetical protein
MAPPKQYSCQGMFKLNLTLKANQVIPQSKDSTGKSEFFRKLIIMRTTTKYEGPFLE